MKRIVNDINFNHLSVPVRRSLCRTLLGMVKLMDKEIELFNQKAIGYLDLDSKDDPWLIDKFGECVEMLERLKLDFQKEADRIKKIETTHQRPL